MAAYPEHEKLALISGHSQTCGEFLDWLLGPKRYEIGEYHQHTEVCVDGTGELTCTTSTDYLFPASINVRKLLAEFFEIDEKKLEAEKRQMLAALPRSA